MHVKYSDLARFGLYPLDLSLGKIQVVLPGTKAGKTATAADLARLSSRQLNRAARIKAQIERLQGELDRVLGVAS